MIELQISKHNKINMVGDSKHYTTRLMKMQSTEEVDTRKNRTESEFCNINYYLACDVSFDCPVSSGTPLLAAFVVLGDVSW